MSGTEIVASSPDDIANLPAEQRGALITHALIESKAWLAIATKGTDPTPIAEFKAWAATVAEMTKQKQLAGEIQLDALEMVRRAEFALGKAIRAGQQAGEIRERGERAHISNQHGESAAPDDNRNSSKASPYDFAKPGELHGNGDNNIYGLTDDVTPAEFDAALSDAKAEGNLSRANVVRKVKGEMKSESPAKTERHEMLRKTHHIRADRVLRELAITLDGAASASALITVSDTDPAVLAEHADSLAASLRTLARFLKEIINVRNVA